MAAAEAIGFPVLIKAAAGGGGRGMKVATDREHLAEAISTAQAEAKAAFGDGSVYLERYLATPRHIEMQVIADSFGAVGAPGRARLFAAAAPPEGAGGSPLAGHRRRRPRPRSASAVTEAIRQFGYLGVGTIEFLYENGEFFFIEMNTRLQVEHPVTECVTDIDLVQEQIRIAAGLAALLHAGGGRSSRATPSSAASMPRARARSPRRRA